MFYGATVATLNGSRRSDVRTRPPVWHTACRSWCKTAEKAGDYRRLSPVDRNKGEPRGDLVEPQQIYYVLIPNTWFPVPEAHKI